MRLHLALQMEHMLNLKKVVEVLQRVLKVLWQYELSLLLVIFDDLINGNPLPFLVWQCANGQFHLLGLGWLN
jgi:hypothetical protein